MKFSGFKNVIVLIAAPPLFPPLQLTGWASGDDAIDMSYNAERAMTKTGADGRAVVSFTADNTGKVVLKFMQTSGAHKILMNFANLQKNANTANVLQMIVQDTYRQDRLVHTNGVITKVPNFVRGAGINEYAWEFFFEQFDPAIEDPNFVGLVTSVAEAQGGA